MDDEGKGPPRLRTMSWEGLVTKERRLRDTEDIYLKHGDDPPMNLVEALEEIHDEMERRRGRGWVTR